MARKKNVLYFQNDNNYRCQLIGKIDISVEL